MRSTASGGFLFAQIAAKAAQDFTEALRCSQESVSVFEQDLRKSHDQHAADQLRRDKHRGMRQIDTSECIGEAARDGHGWIGKAG